METEEKTRNSFTESDHLLAYHLHKLTGGDDKGLKDDDYKLIALSRRTKRTRSSWSRKIVNFNHVVSGGSQHGNAHKVFEKTKAAYESNANKALDLISSEFEPINVKSRNLFISWGIPEGLLPENLTTETSDHLHVIQKKDVLTAARKTEKMGSRLVEHEAVRIGEDSYNLYELINQAYVNAGGTPITESDFSNDHRKAASEILMRYEFVDKQIRKEDRAPNVYNQKQPTENMTYEQRLICALAAKPFVILAGGTGTGKSKSAIETVINLTQSRDQYEFVPVGADWTDTRPLLGFENLLIQDGPKYSTPPSLSLIIRAHNNPDKPYFLILDEMNLSHVERYFSDFLSQMEAKKISGEASTVKLHGKEPAMESAETQGLMVPARMPWPSNLSIIGTVNIDETTHMFSPKVLDRAHVIEFKPKAKVVMEKMREHIAALGPKSSQSSQSHGAIAEIGISWMTRERGRNEEMKNVSQEDLAEAYDKIEDLQKILAGTRFAFSHRTAQESASYVAIGERLITWCNEVPGRAELFKGANFNFVDLAVIQKILPKINGSSETLKTRPASQRSNEDKALGADSRQEESKQVDLLNELIIHCDEKKLPESHAKLAQMIETLKSEHFVSFIQ